MRYYIKEEFHFMRTLKKTLALVLVVAMMLSFGVVGANAAFTDVTETTKYAEEVAVLNAIGVIDGMTTTTFAPDGTLTREQAAKIIAFVKLGPTNAKLIGSASSSRFSDVKADRWSAGYIEYCANLGIIAGNGDGTFAPEGKLTTAAFTKMLLVAVGFDASKFVGDGWALNVATTAIKAGINDNGIAVSATAEITRAQACRLAYLAMFYTATGSTMKYTVMHGTEVVSTWDSFFEAYVVADKLGAGYSVGTTTIATGSLSETVFSLSRTTTRDSFGRPGTSYLNKSGSVDLFFTQTAVATYEGPVKQVTVYSALGLKETTAANWFVNGRTNKNASDTSFALDIAKANTTIGEANAYGTYTEVYKLADNSITVVQYQSFAAKVTKVTPAKAATAVTDATKRTVTVEVYGTDYGTVETTFATESFAKGDYLVVNVVDDGAGAVTVKVSAAASAITGKVDSKTSLGVYNIAGKNYISSLKATKLTAGVGDTAVFYLDAQGNLLYQTTVQSSTSYAMVLGTSSSWTLTDGKLVPTYSATLAYADGTTATVTTAEDYAQKLDGKIVTYTPNAKGLYVLSDVTESTTAVTAITSKVATIATTTYATSATKFIVANFAANDAGGRAATGTVTVYTGINNVPTFSELKVAHAIVKDQIASVVFIYDDIKATESSSYIYLTGTYTETVNAKVYDAIVAGAAATVSIPKTVTADKITDGTSKVAVTAGLYESITITSTTAVLKAASNKVSSIQNVGGLLFTGGTYQSETISDTTPVYTITAASGTCETGTAADLAAEAVTGNIYYSVSGSAVTAVYILK